MLKRDEPARSRALMARALQSSRFLNREDTRKAIELEAAGVCRGKIADELPWARSELVWAALDTTEAGEAVLALRAEQAGNRRPDGERARGRDGEPEAARRDRHGSRSRRLGTDPERGTGRCAGTR